uniref:Uncharacterized protein n=1 Tax=Anopheles merus TaxID=30066 RepID=A0A182V3U8_ANOME
MNRNFTIDGDDEMDIICLDPSILDNDLPPQHAPSNIGSTSTATATDAPTATSKRSIIPHRSIKKSTAPKRIKMESAGHVYKAAEQNMQTKRFDSPLTSAAAAVPGPSRSQSASTAPYTQRRNSQPLTAALSLMAGAVPGPSRSQGASAAPSSAVGPTNVAEDVWGTFNTSPSVAPSVVPPLNDVQQLIADLKAYIERRFDAIDAAIESLASALRNEVPIIRQTSGTTEVMVHDIKDVVCAYLVGTAPPVPEDFTLQPIDSVKELHSIERKLGEVQYMRDVLAYLQSQVFVPQVDKRLKMARGIIFSPQFLRNF